jgi:hypothetical protein
MTYITGVPKDETIADQLRSAIKASDESEYAIWKASGVHQSVINRFVHRHQGISLQTAAKLCEHLGFSLLAPKAPKKIRKSRRSL